MRFSLTFSIYVVRRLLINLFYFFAIFIAVSFIIDFLELSREAEGKTASLIVMLKMVSYKIPFIVISFLPFIFLFGTILTFTKLNNNFELAAAKSAGISVWSLSLPIILSIFIIGLFILFVLQPISAVFFDYNRVLGVKYLGYNNKRVSLQENGIWLYDQTLKPEDEKIIFIKNIIKKGKFLSEVLVYRAGEKHDFLDVFYADLGYIESQRLVLSDVYEYKPETLRTYHKQVTFPTNLLVDQIQESIPSPEIISFWKLKEFISQIKLAGFDTLKHEFYYKSLIVSPLQYISLVLIALACSTNLPRSGKLGTVFVSGGIIGITVFFINKMVSVMALTGSIPINLAVIAPSSAYLFLSFAALIHSEEG